MTPSLKPTPLKPCPFCGGTNISSGEIMSGSPQDNGQESLQTACLDCRASGPEIPCLGETMDDHESADIAWNRRTLERDLAGAGATQSARDVMAERERQKSVEGWTEAHDDQHTRGEMVAAASTYALATIIRGLSVDLYWPWDMKWWKPKKPRQNLVRAAALIVAEIERLDRAALRLGGKATEQGGGAN